MEDYLQLEFSLTLQPLILMATLLLNQIQTLITLILLPLLIIKGKQKMNKPHLI